MTLRELVEQGALRLEQAGVAFGHGTTNAFDEAAWLVLWQLGLPLDSDLEVEPEAALKAAAQNTASGLNMPQMPTLLTQIAMLFDKRIATRQPAAYLTHEAWLQGVPFYVDERAIVPRSLIAELLANGDIDPWLGEHTRKVLDLCTGNGSLAVLAALNFPDVTVTGSDLSADALAVAQINVAKHSLQDRITLTASDGLGAPSLQQQGPFDLILCNPPYVNAQSMVTLPPEYLAEPTMALSGNLQGGRDGMDFIRVLLQDAPAQMGEQAVLVLEIGNERDNFEAAFPLLEVVWLETSAGGDQVLLVTRESLQHGSL